MWPTSWQPGGKVCRVQTRGGFVVCASAQQEEEQVEHSRKRTTLFSMSADGSQVHAYGLVVGMPAENPVPMPLYMSACMEHWFA
eukprot:362423-Chlamydomonas_euryale.AAC.3